MTENVWKGRTDWLPSEWGWPDRSLTCTELLRQLSARSGHTSDRAGAPIGKEMTFGYPPRQAILGRTLMQRVQQSTSDEPGAPSHTALRTGAIVPATCLLLAP